MTNNHEENENNSLDLNSSDEKDINNSTEHENEEKDKRTLRISIYVLCAVLLGSGLGIGYGIIDRNNTASQELQTIIDSRSDIVPLNTDVIQYNNEENSYALSLGEQNAPDTGAFVFGNDNGQYSRIVDVYIDYSNSRSRDFFFANNTMLRNLVESSEVQLRIHPVVQENHPYSAYAAEAMAQAFHKYPDKAWDVNIALLQLLEEVNEIEEPTFRDITDAIHSELSRHLDINDIDTELIIEGMFTNWIASGASDPKLEAGTAPPIVYSNGQLIPSEFYYVSDDLRTNILSPSSDEFNNDDISNNP